MRFAAIAKSIVEGKKKEIDLTVGLGLILAELEKSETTVGNEVRQLVLRRCNPSRGSIPPIPPEYRLFLWELVLDYCEAEAPRPRGAPASTADQRHLTRSEVPFSRSEEAASMSLETGPMPADSPFYVVRDPDDHVMKVLLSGQAVAIYGSRQVGKSSFLRRIEARLGEQDFKVVPFDFHLLGNHELESVASAYRRIATAIVQRLELNISVARYFEGGSFPAVALLNLVGDAFSQVADPVSLLFDNVDRIFETTISEDFFKGFRHFLDQLPIENSATRDCRAVFAYTENPHFWLRDANQSAFGAIAYSHQLKEFSIDDLRYLQRLHPSGIEITEAHLAQLLSLLGGHPALSRIALHSLSTGMTFEQLRSVSAEDHGPFGSHLRWLLNIFIRSEALTSALHGLIETGACRSEREFQSLQAIGVVRGGSHRDAKFRNDLYTVYLTRKL